MYDQVNIVTIPRFKSSAASGSEWRIRARLELRYKGRLEYASEHANVDEVLRELPLTLHRAANSFMRIDSHFHEHENTGEPLCDQEGCAELATTAYRVLRRPCRECGARDAPEWACTRQSSRYFCARHSFRGDGGIDDAQSNYEHVAGLPPTQPPADDVASVAGIVCVYGDAIVGGGDDDDDDDDDDSA